MNVTPLEHWILTRTQPAQKSQEALRAYQFGELLKALTYAKDKSRFYQTALETIDLSAIRSLKDFEKIPFTTPADIKHNAYDFVCVSSNDIDRIVTLNTSGTTGDEKRIFFTHEDLEATIDFFQHGMHCLVDASDKVMVLLPGPAYGSIGDLLKKALAKSGIECIVHGVLNDVEKTALCIQKNNITCIVGIPMQVFYLSKLKPDVFYTHIKKVLLSTDYVPDALVEALSYKGACKVFNHYGMTEMGYGGGVECECLGGYHLRENDLYFEIVDPITGALVEDGVYGEVVFTTLHRQAMPLIRYRTGDMARFSTQPCACGTFLRTMEKVLGRIDNKIEINQHEIHLRDMDEILLKFGAILDYKLTMSENNALHIQLILTHKSECEALKKVIVQQIKERFAFMFELTIEAKEDDHSINITNSMIKRKLHHYRQGN
ncbi:DVU_1553 family AMP-dependent CoA ligase [Sulfurospirillum sp.]|jgi:phenylacetate-coenzyme A ligase PaaK-like adenylate-forming protein|uniref:DVU_1553 family AMP-dependent CoA ligase n=1 Tax=Sulfurospirillum sp. TaxID=2053622 RepID=UPI002FDD5BB0